MAYTVTQLITDAYYLSGIVSNELETVSGAQYATGFKLLNDVLAIKTANRRLIPYFEEFDLTLVPGQEEYFIPKLLSVQTMVFNIGVVRYSMSPTTEKIYFGSGRVDNVNSLPFNYAVRRTLGGANIFVYFLPSQNFPVKIWGKFSLANESFNDDMSTKYDEYYILFLRYTLAEYLCEYNNVAFSPGAAQKLKEYEDIITDISPMDLTQDKVSCLQNSPGLTWAQINIGKGYTP